VAGKAIDQGSAELQHDFSFGKFIDLINFKNTLGANEAYHGGLTE
jgi:hypothetical protein